MLTLDCKLKLIKSMFSKPTFFNVKSCTCFDTAKFEDNENCRCLSSTSNGLMTIKCHLPKTTNQTSEPPTGNIWYQNLQNSIFCTELFTYTTL